jgi:peptide/nickel transport system substrate-binding protein
MRSSLRLLAASSLLALLLVSAAWAETRPRYGGTLRVEMRAAPPSLDPAAAATGDDPGFAQIAPLVYDTLVRLDATGRATPSLASSWQQESEHRWRFTVGAGVRFSDGSALTPTAIVQSLHEANPEWNLRAIGDAVVMESEQPLPDLPAALALPRNSIVLRADGKLLGTGPFRVHEFQAGRRLSVAAVEDGWHERPFVDAVDIQFNRGAREQMMDLELGRADIVEVAPDQLAHLNQSGRRVFASDPVDLLALRFSHSNLRDARVREAIALTVDRDSIYNVLLQRHGEPTAGLLPNWITGYSFLFATAPQVARARQLRAEAKLTAALTLVYDAADPLARLVAERVALNANDAGITLKTLPSTQNVTVPDIELVRLRLASTDPVVALAEVSRTDRLALFMPELVAPPLSAPGFGADKVGLSEVYGATVAALQDHWAVPIAYLPAASAVSPRVRNWTRTRDGSWQLENAWLAPEAR